MKPRLSPESSKGSRNRLTSAELRISPFSRILGRIGWAAALVLACGPRQQLDQPDLSRPTAADASTSPSDTALVGDGGSVTGSDGMQSMPPEMPVPWENCIKEGKFEDRDQDDLCGDCDPKDPNDGTRLFDGKTGPCDPFPGCYSPLKQADPEYQGADTVTCRGGDGGKQVKCFVGNSEIFCPIPPDLLRIMQDMGNLDGSPADAAVDGGAPGDAGLDAGADDMPKPGDAGALDGGVSDSAADGGRVDDGAPSSDGGDGAPDSARGDGDSLDGAVDGYEGDQAMFGYKKNDDNY